MPEPSPYRSHTEFVTGPETGIGPVTVVAEDGRIVGVHLHDQRHRPDAASFGPPDGASANPVTTDAPTDAPTVNTAVLAAAVTQLRGYLAGELEVFDLPLHLEGSEFQRRVWAELATIPYGARRSYGEVAAAIGAPAAARAVGLATGRNPIAIVVPCHRVVGADGSLTGYGGGLDRKRVLLDLEGQAGAGARAAGGSAAP